MGKTIVSALTNAARRTAEMPIPYTGRSASNTSFLGRLTGAQSQMRAMSSVGTLFAIVDRTSNATALVEWKLWRKAKSGRDEDRVEVTAHAALDLWNKPNPFMPRQEFVEAQQQHHDLTGEAWWVIARAPGYSIPLEMWPVRPDRMTPVPDREKFLAGYMYTSPDGEQIALGLDEVIQIRRPNPMDPYRGLSPVLSILPDLDTARYSAEWARAFFRNSAQPGGIIEVPGHLQDGEFNELRDRWNEQHRGVGNAHRVAIIEQGKWVDRTISQRDMQFVELRGVTRDAIREAYGISKSAIGDFADINRATALAAKAWFAEQITVPRLERIKAALNHDLLPMFGPAASGLEFDYCNPVPEDAETEAALLTARANAAQSLAAAGYDRPAVAAACGLPELPYDAERDLLVRIVTGAPSTAPIILPLLGFTLPTPAAPAPSNRALPAGPANTWDTAVAHLVNAAPGGDLGQVRADHDDALAQLLGQWAPIEDKWITALGQQITTAIDGDDTTALAALTVDTDQASGVLRGALAGMAKRAAGRVVDEAAAQGVTVEAPEVDKALTNRAGLASVRAVFGAELVDIAAATAVLLGAAMAAAAGREALRLVSPGADGASVATQVKTFLRGLTNRLKLDQLGGALHRAANTGRIATLEAAPVAVYTASEANDSNTCPPCDDIDGTEFTDLDAVRAAYGAGPYRLCEGGIRCRGTVVATWEAIS